MFRCKQQPDKNMHCILLLIESMKLHNARRMCTGIQIVFFDIFAPFSTSRLNGKKSFLIVHMMLSNIFGCCFVHFSFFVFFVVVVEL